MNCLICNRIEQIRTRSNRHFVAELETGFVVLGDYQFFRGYTLFLAKQHAAELHELQSSVKERFLIEMSWVAEAVYKAFSPVKLNYECLGNAEPHLHWHIFPRHSDDPSPGTSSWKVDRAIRYDEGNKLTAADLIWMRRDILEALEKIEGISILSTWQSDTSK
ncbi:MAG: HIT family protein [Verrucomicrobiales bacterium]|nr:HIT family protein [Verrucomicrobiales bacterium]